MPTELGHEKRSQAPEPRRPQGGRGLGAPRRAGTSCIWARTGVSAASARNSRSASARVKLATERSMRSRQSRWSSGSASRWMALTATVPPGASVRSAPTTTDPAGANVTAHRAARAVGCGIAAHPGHAELAGEVVLRQSARRTYASWRATWMARWADDPKPKSPRAAAWLDPGERAEADDPGAEERRSLDVVRAGQGEREVAPGDDLLGVAAVRQSTRGTRPARTGRERRSRHPPQAPASHASLPARRFPRSARRPGARSACASRCRPRRSGGLSGASRRLDDHLAGAGHRHRGARGRSAPSTAIAFTRAWSPGPVSCPSIQRRIHHRTRPRVPTSRMRPRPHARFTTRSRRRSPARPAALPATAVMGMPSAIDPIATPVASVQSHRHRPPCAGRPRTATWTSSR